MLRQSQLIVVNLHHSLFFISCIDWGSELDSDVAWVCLFVGQHACLDVVNYLPVLIVVMLQVFPGVE